jgi:hypothetical protein
MALIVQIIADGRPGGGTTVVLTLGGELARRGEEIVLITQQGSHLASEGRRAGFRLIGLDFTSRKNTPRLALQLHQLLRELNPAIIHVHGGRAGLPLAMIPRPCPASNYP